MNKFGRFKWRRVRRQWQSFPPEFAVLIEDLDKNRLLSKAATELCVSQNLDLQTDHRVSVHSGFHGYAQKYGSDCLDVLTLLKTPRSD